MAAHPLSDPAFLRALAAEIGTPFLFYEADVLRKRIATIRDLVAGPSLAARFAMKACSAHLVLREMQKSGVWIDAVSGNEVLRAKRAGFAMGAEPPVVLLTADVFRDNALDVIRSERVLPNLGSPGQLRTLAEAGYRGPVGLRVNPGFGHGHVRATDTGGPSSKHGIWLDDLLPLAAAAERDGFPVTLLHAHVGSGPEVEEFNENVARLALVFENLLPGLPSCSAVSFGGGLPHSYRDPSFAPDLGPLGRTLRSAQESFRTRTGRDIRVEIEPGRFFVAPCATVVARVADRKHTRTNEKGEGHGFLMVDAGFVDLVRPAMYGAFHRISVVGDRLGPPEAWAVAGPLCESGDVFTRDAAEIVQPRDLPTPEPGDFVLLHDAGAYGAVMSSNYNSLGRAPQVWWEEGRATLMSRRETLDDVVAAECEEPLRTTSL
ncbi:MAG: diaminopimelate decarboxylase [Deltaproteobacteria bacterium]|nr:diaminopimelate decarboxylase [Deltaproteobacteria bacterium]